MVEIRAADETCRRFWPFSAGLGRGGDLDTALPWRPPIHVQPLQRWTPPQATDLRPIALIASFPVV